MQSEPHERVFLSFQPKVLGNTGYRKPVFNLGIDSLNLALCQSRSLDGPLKVGVPSVCLLLVLLLSLIASILAVRQRRLPSPPDLLWLKIDLPQGALLNPYLVALQSPSAIPPFFRSERPGSRIMHLYTSI